MRLLTVTIDTNSINVRAANADLNQLEQWHQDGRVEITRTRMLDEELAADKTRLGDLRRHKARTYRRGREAFTMRRSTVRGGDTLRGPSASRWVQAITTILHPGRDHDHLGANDQRDILHLAIHKAQDWDYFVTLDKGVLGQAGQLRRQLGVCVVSPDEAVREIGISLSEEMDQPR